jgi:hypothetical protein
MKKHGEEGVRFLWKVSRQTFIILLYTLSMINSSVLIEDKNGKIPL